MIQLRNVVKEFARSRRPGGKRVRALDGVNLGVPAGTALGIVGLNGAGKSTLLRLLLGYARPTSGEATIDGIPPRRYVERYGIAYVPERVSIPAHWTVRHALRTYAMLGEIPGNAWERVDWALARLGLESLALVRVGSLSKGNAQRVGIAQALLADRKLMVLDEPTDGLDPVWVANLRDIIKEWREADADRVVVLASHNLPEVERLADQVQLLHNGRLTGELWANQSSLEDVVLERIRELGEARG
jgi:ABC-2 type transport system ATP-binding protein